MNKEELINSIVSSDELPTLPPVASKLVSLMADEGTTFTDIANLVSQDMALSAKILKVSNSAFYGFPQQIGSIHQAASILGTNALSSLVLSFSFLSMGTGEGRSRFDFEDFWQRSLAAGAAARLILEQVSGAEAEEAFVSGLLQNMGQLILCSTFPEKYDEVLTIVEEGSATISEAESTVFGAQHSFVGYEVAKRWGFPPALTLPILYHHEPEEYKGSDKNLRLLTRAMYLSDFLVRILYDDRPDEYERKFQRESKKLLNLKTADIDKILATFHTEVSHIGASFGIKFGAIKPVHEILQEANIRLSLMNLDYEQMNKQLIEAKVALEKLTKELQEKNRILDNLAHVDGLTEVYNNRYFQGALDRELSRDIRNGGHFSLVLLDIDHFKKFNDSYGHLVGDFVLSEFAKVLGSNLREHDILARYGGEEFVVILPDTHEEGALVVADKLRKAVENHPFKEGASSYKVTASFGVSLFDSSDDEAPGKEELIKRADVALYEAKEQGRNKVVAFRPKKKKKWFGGS